MASFDDGERRRWLTAGALVAVALLHRIAYYGARAELAFFLRDAPADGGLGLSPEAAFELYEGSALLAAAMPALGALLGFIFRARIALLVGLGAMTTAQLLLGSTNLAGVSDVLALQAAGHGAALVGLLAAAGSLFDERTRRLALFLVVYAAVETGAGVGPAAVAAVADAFGVDRFVPGAAGLLVATSLAVAVCFLRAPRRIHTEGFFRGLYGAILFGGALVWFRVLATAHGEWAHDMERGTRVAGWLLPGTVAGCLLMAVAAGSGRLERKPFSDNRLTAWGLSASTLGLVALIFAHQADPTRVSLALAASDVLSTIAWPLMYAAVAVVASVSGSRLSSLFVGGYLAIAGITTEAASSMVYSTGMAWALALITLLLAAVIGCWHWNEHAEPE